MEIYKRGLEIGRKINKLGNSDEIFEKISLIIKNTYTVNEMFFPTFKLLVGNLDVHIPEEIIEDKQLLTKLLFGINNAKTEKSTREENVYYKIGRLSSRALKKHSKLKIYNNLKYATHRNYTNVKVRIALLNLEDILINTEDLNMIRDFKEVFEEVHVEDYEKKISSRKRDDSISDYDYNCFMNGLLSIVDTKKTNFKKNKFEVNEDFGISDEFKD